MAELVTKSDLLATEQRLQTEMDTLGLRLTIRLGAMIVVATGTLATVMKLVH